MEWDRDSVKSLSVALMMIALAGIGYAQWQSGQRIKTGPIELAPEQTSDPNPLPFIHAGMTLEPKAIYKIQAKLLSKKHYSFGDDATVMPWDFALGWGPMSREDVLKELDISQSGRFYFYHWSGLPPLAPRLIIESSANMHLIPATPAIEKILASARPGSAVELEGRLVDVVASDGRRWASSLTRSDTGAGAGACEIM
jgi:hypothetical protein